MLAVKVAGEDGVIRCTAEHAFFVRGKGWVAAGEMGAGDELRMAGGGFVEVEEVAGTGRTEAVFNLHVEADHTYFVMVGGVGVWVHNEYETKGFGERLIEAAGRTLHNINPTFALTPL
jgi:hypothetical protein